MALSFRVKVSVVDHLNRHPSLSLLSGTVHLDIFLLVIASLPTVILGIYHHIILSSITIGTSAAEKHGIALIGGIRQALCTYTTSIIIVRPSQSDTLSDVSRMICEDLHLIIICNKDSLLLKLIEVAEAGEPFLRERQELDAIHLAAALTH